MQGLILLSLLFAASLAFPTSNHAVHEKRDTPLNHPRQRLHPDAIIPIRIAIQQSNLHIGHDRLMDISHPSSPNYGKHLSPEEVHNLFAPSEASFNAVKSWLIDSGLDESDILHYENKGWLALDIPARRAENLLKTKYYEYEDSDSYRIGCDAYSLPSHLAEHVDFVKPGIKLSAPLRKRTVKRGEPGWPIGGHHHWPGPHHLPPNPWPHWHPPGPAHGLPPQLQNCGVNIT